MHNSWQKASAGSEALTRQKDGCGLANVFVPLPDSSSSQLAEEVMDELQRLKRGTKYQHSRRALTEACCCRARDER